jgi:hypothetical protein
MAEYQELVRVTPGAKSSVFLTGPKVEDEDDDEYENDSRWAETATFSLVPGVRGDPGVDGVSNGVDPR